MASASRGNSVPYRPTILVVEDEPLIRCAAIEEFGLAGWNVFEAASGEAALLLIEQHRPRVIFTDINLGGRVTGWEVGSVGCACGARILFTSGERAALTLPNSIFFLKPYEIGAVVARCSESIGH
jgi:DNA-binding LytR/AlgR family response regulator